MLQCVAVCVACPVAVTVTVAVTVAATVAVTKSRCDTMTGSLQLDLVTAITTATVIAVTCQFVHCAKYGATCRLRTSELQ